VNINLTYDINSECKPDTATVHQLFELSRSKGISFESYYSETHIQPTNCSIWTTKVILDKKKYSRTHGKTHQQDNTVICYEVDERPERQLHGVEVDCMLAKVLAIL